MGRGVYAQGSLNAVDEPWEMEGLPTKSKVPEGKAVGVLKVPGFNIRQSCVQILLLLACHMNLNALLHLLTSQFSYPLYSCICKLSFAGLLQSFIFLKNFSFISH